MKTEHIVLIGGAALVAYMFLNKKAASSPISDLAGAIDNIGNVPGQIAQALTPNVPAVENAVIQAGGILNQAVNANAYSGFDAGAASVMANADFINQLRAANIIAVNVAPTASGSGIIQLRAGNGVGAVVGQAAIDAAIKAATNATYGVSLATGGANVFNITSQGQPATTAYTTQASIASAMARGLF